MCLEADHTGVRRLKIFYVYEHWRPDQDAPFYVGKGKGRRAYVFRGRNSHHQRIVGKLRAMGLEVEIRIIASNLYEEDAFKIEQNRIAAFRASGIELANKTIGGDGAAGLPISEEAKEKIRRKAIGRKASEETKAKMRAARFGTKVPEAVRLKMSEALTRAYECPKLRAKIGDIHRGKRYSDATKQKIREARQRQGNPPQSAAGRIAAANKNRGQKRSEATKALLRLRWEERRRQNTPGMPS